MPYVLKLNTIDGKFRYINIDRHATFNQADQAKKKIFDEMDNIMHYKNLPVSWSVFKVNVVSIEVVEIP